MSVLVMGKFLHTSTKQKFKTIWKDSLQKTCQVVLRKELVSLVCRSLLVFCVFVSLSYFFRLMVLHKLRYVQYNLGCKMKLKKVFCGGACDFSLFYDLLNAIEWVFFVTSARTRGSRQAFQDWFPTYSVCLFWFVQAYLVELSRTLNAAD